MVVGGARTEFLIAGRELLDEASLADYLGRAVTVDALCRRAGRSPGGFYHHWTSIDAYCRDLLLSTVDEANAELFDCLVTELAHLPDIGEPAKVFDYLRAFLATYLDTVLATSWGGRAELLVWVSDDDELRNEIDSRSNALDHVAAEIVPDALAAWDRELRPPWDTETLVRAVSVILWGTQILDRLDPSPTYRKLAVDMALGVVALATRQRRSDIDGDDFLRLSLGVGRDGSASPWADALRRRTAALIVDLYRTGGWSAVTPAAVAEAADEYIQDIDVVWSGRSGFAAAVWAVEVVPELRAALDADALAADRPGDEVAAPVLLSRHVERLVRAARTHADAAAAFLALTIGAASTASQGTRRPVPDLTGLTGVTTRALALSVHAAGRSDAAGPGPVLVSAETAATLNRLVLTETLSRPGDDVAQIAAHLLLLVGFVSRNRN